jgi:hypothetical protein
LGLALERGRAVGIGAGTGSEIDIDTAILGGMSEKWSDSSVHKTFCRRCEGLELPALDEANRIMDVRPINENGDEHENNHKEPKEHQTQILINGVMCNRGNTMSKQGTQCQSGKTIR